MCTCVDFTVFWSGLESWDSSVNIIMGYGLDDCGLIPGVAKRFFSSPQYPDWV
jgi:hypothetical protein